jgi:hypothetical protein
VEHKGSAESAPYFCGVNLAAQSFTHGGLRLERMDECAQRGKENRVVAKNLDYCS